MSNYINEQQWTPIIINKTSPKGTTTDIVPKKASLEGKLTVDINDETFRKNTKALPADKIAELIKIRLDTKQTQSDLCKKLALPKGTITEIEQGKEVSLATYDKVRTYISRQQKQHK